jgi:hypothetical protein
VVKLGAGLPLMLGMSARETLVRVQHLGCSPKLAGTPSATRWPRRPAPTLPVRAPRGRGLRRAAVVGAVLLLTCLGAGLALAVGEHESEFSRRLSLGCDEIEACQRLEVEAERRVEDCWLACGDVRAEHRLARFFRYRVEERRAVREHYRQRGEAERRQAALDRARQLEESRRLETAHAEEAQREHQGRLELERLRQANVERRLSEQYQRRVAYLVLLGEEGRARRLRRCMHASGGCGELVLELIDAASGDAEKRSLAKLNEQLAAGETPDAARAESKASPDPAPASS